MNKSSLLIFDCDGVLVDSESISTRILAEELRANGVAIKNEEAVQLFKGGTLKSAFEFAEQQINRKLPADIESRYRARCKSSFAEELEPIHGVAKALEQLTDQVKCVASNGPGYKVKSNLELTKLTKHFGNNIYSAYDINKWKPDPALFEYAAESMEVAAENCIVIEDSLHGVQAGVAAGMKVIAYVEHRDDTFKDFQELTPWIVEDMDLLVETIHAI